MLFPILEYNPTSSRSHINERPNASQLAHAPTIVDRYSRQNDAASQCGRRECLWNDWSRPLVDSDYSADMEVVQEQGYRGVEHDVDVVSIMHM